MAKREVEPVSAGDVPALELLVEALLGENERMQWEVLVGKAREGTLAAPETIQSRADAMTWMAWARTHNHQEGCLCHRCKKARPLLLDPSGLLRG
jgi:hypothetical protein